MSSIGHCFFQCEELQCSIDSVKTVQSFDTVAAQRLEVLSGNIHEKDVNRSVCAAKSERAEFPSLGCSPDPYPLLIYQLREDALAEKKCLESVQAPC